MKLLVLGASGGVGCEVVRQAHARGHDSHVLLRQESRLPWPSGTTVLCGSVLQERAVEEAGAGCDAVVVCLGLRRRHPLSPWSRLVSPRDLTQRAIRLTLRAMRRHGQRRIVVISAAGVRESWSATNLAMRLLIRWSNIGVAYRDLGGMERALEESSFDWAAVRPVTLTNSTRPQRIAVVPFYGLASTISRCSVASFVLDQVERPGPLVDRTPMIAAVRR